MQLLTALPKSVNRAKREAKQLAAFRETPQFSQEPHRWERERKGEVKKDVTQRAGGDAEPGEG